MDCEKAREFIRHPRRHHEEFKAGGGAALIEHLEFCNECLEFLNEEILRTKSLDQLVDWIMRPDEEDD